MLGTGYWADTVHAVALGAHPEVELAGVWGRDPVKAAAVAERHRTTAEPDLGALLDRVDAVAIAVAPAAQPELACRAAEAGCQLLAEKPLALSAADADRVAAAVDRAGVASVIFFTNRFTEPTATWFHDVVAPREWHGGTMTLLASIFEPGNHFGEAAWRAERGALWDVGPHALASLLPALGAVEEVTAVRGTGDTVHLALSHAGGRSSGISLSLTVPATAVCSELVLWGPSGLHRAPSGDGSITDGYRRAISALLEAAGSGTPHACDARFGAEVVRVLAEAEGYLER